MEKNNTPGLGTSAPGFSARTTKGITNFPADFKEKWVVMYAYPGDFLPNSAMDILELDKAVPKFKSYNAEIVAVSPDSVPAHIAWIFSLRNHKNDGSNIDIELISDKADEIASLYGITSTSDDMSENEKMVLILDPDGIVRSVHKYSTNMGINVTEIERELLALQTARYQFGQTPAGWTPGDDILEHPPQTITTAGSNMSDKEALGLRCIDWYICFRPDSGLRKQSPTIGTQK